MVLTGSLLVGDSLKGTLRRQALDRIGQVRSVLVGGDRMFRSALAGELSARVAPVLMLAASVNRSDAKARINRAQLIGVDPRFWNLSVSGRSFELGENDAILNTTAAKKLGVEEGDSLVVRVEKPSAFSKDAPLSGEEDTVESIRVEVRELVDDSCFGRFALHASQISPPSIFVSIEMLQRRLEIEGRANVLLAADLSAESLTSELKRVWTANDSSLNVRGGDENELLLSRTEVRTGRVFLDDKLIRALPNGSLSLTYFVNGLRSGERATPYSMVSAVEPGSELFVPADLQMHEIIVSDWLADDLELKVGSEVELTYYVMDSKRRLEERLRKFTVRAIAPLERNGWNTSWMPDFPGLADVGNCRDWKPGFALDTKRIREKDEVYWKEHRGAPKAFISLNAGREMWENRWGSATAVRYSGSDANQRRIDIAAGLTPQNSGMQVLAFRDLAIAATDAPVDFAGLFVGFSTFLIAAALVLVGLLFALMVEQRSREVGTLLAVGWLHRDVRLLFLSEGLLVALLGALIGAAAGLFFTASVLDALSSVWKGATGGIEVTFFAAPSSIFLGSLSGAFVAVCAMALVLRRAWRSPVRELLLGCIAEPAVDGARGRKLSAQLLLGVAGVIAAVFVVAFSMRGQSGGAELLFGVGALVLVSLLSLSSAWLRGVAAGLVFNMRQLALRNAGRRLKRSLAVIGVLASGVFLVLSVQVFQKNTKNMVSVRSSGTGGFALMGDFTMPVYEDLNEISVRENLGIPNEPGVRALSIRVKEGEDASCLNLNRAVNPKVLGVPSSDLGSLGAFGFARAGDGWNALRRAADGLVPALVDEATLMWALQKRVGDVISVPDGRGGQVQMRVVGALKASVLQGAILIDESHFVEAFPDAGGYRALLLDVPQEKIDLVRASWSRALEDRGLELYSVQERLAELDAVSNAYLSIFQILGGLGVLLGAVGVGVVAARNAVDRRSELAVMMALGWRTSQVYVLLGLEHAMLVAVGLSVGGLSALWVTVPAQMQRGDAVSIYMLLAPLGVLGLVSLLAVGLGLWLSVVRDPGAQLRQD
jgi:ABC-type lipoprotein release transport system permease subunit